MFFWYHDDRRCLWEFRDRDRTRVIAALADEVIWEAREEPNRSMLQAWVVRHGMLPIPDRAFPCLASEGFMTPHTCGRDKTEYLQGNEHHHEGVECEDWAHCSQTSDEQKAMQ